jgi:sugar lactone lactonase YvrE
MIAKKIHSLMAGRSVRLGAILVGIFSLSLLLTWGFTRSDSRVIQTVAGMGAPPGYAGDGGLAIQAKMNTMQGLVMDANGNLYIAGQANHVVRRVDPSGIISTVAGLGPNQIGFNGDNQLATRAQLASPSDVALDAAGNLYIADSGNQRIRRVDSHGMITTVAGTGEEGFSGDDGPATAAKLKFPSSIAFDAAGNLYIADARNYRIRRVDASTGIITTIAGSGKGFAGDGGPATAAKFAEMTDLVIGPAGDIFVADSLNHRVRRIDSDGIVTTVAGNGSFNVYSAAELGDGGQATDAVVRLPYGLAFDSAGNLYIAENRSNRIRRVDTSGKITTVAGSGDPRVPSYSGDGGPADQATLNGPSGVMVDLSGNIYISDSLNYRVRKVNAQ